MLAHALANGAACRLGAPELAAVIAAAELASPNTAAAAAARNQTRLCIGCTSLRGAPGASGSRRKLALDAPGASVACFRRHALDEDRAVWPLVAGTSRDERPLDEPSTKTGRLHSDEFGPRHVSKRQRSQHSCRLIRAEEDGCCSRIRRQWSLTPRELWSGSVGARRQRRRHWYPLVAAKRSAVFVKPQTS